MEEIDQFYAKIRGIFGDKWRLEANCYKYPEDYFFNPENFDIATPICAECPVRVECLDDSMYNGDEGFRGGMGEEERISLFLYRKRHSSIFKHDMSFLNEIKM